MINLTDDLTLKSEGPVRYLYSHSQGSNTVDLEKKIQLNKLLSKERGQHTECRC